MVNLLVLSPRVHEFDPRLLKPFIWGFKPRSTSPYDVAVSGVLKLIHSFELSLASIAHCVRKVCFFCDRHPFHMGSRIDSMPL